MNEIDPAGRMDDNFEEAPDHDALSLEKENDYLKARLNEYLKEQDQQRQKNKK